MIARVGAVQIWPEWNVHTEPIIGTAVFTSASSNTSAGALAAELEQRALHRAPADFGDAQPDAGRTGERHHVDVAALDERFTGRRVSSR